MAEQESPEKMAKDAVKSEQDSSNIISIKAKEETPKEETPKENKEVKEKPKAAPKQVEELINK